MEGTTARDACQAGGLPLACDDCGAELRGQIAGRKAKIAPCPACSTQARQDLGRLKMKLAAAERETSEVVTVAEGQLARVRERADRLLVEVVTAVSEAVARGVAAETTHP